VTIEIDNLAEIIAAVEVVAWVAGVASMLLVCLLFYLLVRPPRRPKAPPPAELDAGDAERMWRVLDRMEGRLEVLERALADERRAASAGKRDLEPIDGDREARRTK
jgi:hypothetical protein